MAVKRREQALQDYRRLQAKVEKYEEKEKTGPVLAKLHQVQREEGGEQQGKQNNCSEVLTWGPTDPGPSLFPHPVPFSNSPDTRVLFPRPEKSCGLCGKTSRPRTNSSWMRCHGSTAADLTTSSPALSP